MKLSCLPVSYFKQIISEEMPIEKWAQEASGIGFDAIDISILFLKNKDLDYLEEYKEKIAKMNMHIAIVNTYPDFTHPDPSERSKQVKKLQSDIEAASVLGAELLRVTAGQAHPQTSIEDGVAWAVEGLKISADFAKDYNIELVYENHSKPGIWEYPDFSFPPNIFLNILNKIKHTGIKVLFDTANPLAYGEDPLCLLENVFDQVICIHAADLKERKKLEHTTIGTGIVPFGELFRFLVKNNYDKWISIEEASNRGHSGIKEGHDFIRKTWIEAGNI